MIGGVRGIGRPMPSLLGATALRGMGRYRAPDPGHFFLLKISSLAFLIPGKRPRRLSDRGLWTVFRAGFRVRLYSCAFFSQTAIKSGEQGQTFLLERQTRQSRESQAVSPTHREARRSKPGAMRFPRCAGFRPRLPVTP